MATITINTNVSAMIAQRSLNQATDRMNQAIERMTTGYKINHAKDNAAGYSIANSWETKLGSLDVAYDNAATGLDLLTTAEETYGLLTSHLQRVRDLTEQAANGTYGSQSLKAIHGEISARLFEINRISANAEFNGIKLMAYDVDADADSAVNAQTGLTDAGINLQVGLYADTDSIINLDINCFSNASISGLFNGLLSTASIATGMDLQTLLNNAAGDKDTEYTMDNLFNTDLGMGLLSAACTGLYIGNIAEYDPDDPSAFEATYYLQKEATCTPKEMLEFIDLAIDDISKRATKIGAAQNRVQSAVEALDVQSQNLTSSLSTLRDTDVAEESSTYIQQQILQQASATLLSTANQLPSIALNLI